MTRRLAALAGVAAAVSLLAAPAGAASRSPYATACRAAPTVTASSARVAAPSALPPTPLSELLFSAQTALVARVTAVLYQGPRPVTPRRPPGFVGPIPPSRCQVVRLAVTRTLKGTAPASLVAVKPTAPYTLTASRRVQAGTFLLDGAAPYPTILGNYGPSPYDPAAVAAALAGRPG
ncbi:MAG TPA: hypothetical protein VGU73_03500 [Acidimicrobiia bacterium]|nr:hypothetical protein [Acidimicrobiia bacterium]